MKKIIVLLSIVSLVSGCVAPQGKIATWQMSSNMQNRGFSVKRPSDNRWYLNTYEQNPYQALFRMNGSEIHSIFASITLEEIAKHPSSIDEFEQMVESMMTAPSVNGTTKLLEYTSTKSTKQGQWCINYSSKSLSAAVNVADRHLIMTMKGFVVLHPNWPKTIIDAHVSQRGDEPDLDPEIDLCGKKLLDGVILESAPGKEI